jgi:hypothetical protein
MEQQCIDHERLDQARSDAGANIAVRGYRRSNFPAARTCRKKKESYRDPQHGPIPLIVPQVVEWESNLTWTASSLIHRGNVGLHQTELNTIRFRFFLIFTRSELPGVPLKHQTMNVTFIYMVEASWNKEQSAHFGRTKSQPIDRIKILGGDNRRVLWISISSLPVRIQDLVCVSSS